MNTGGVHQCRQMDVGSVHQGRWLYAGSDTKADDWVRWILVVYTKVDKWILVEKANVD